MITIQPISRALVPIDSAAAGRVSAPNYDEFQGDREIWDTLQANPESVLAVTMAHCDTASPAEIGGGDSEASLARAAANMRGLARSDLTREVQRALFCYEIRDAARPGIRQIGLGGMARTEEIRTEATPEGPIIRNEGIRPPKARGRADLIEATSAIIGTVNVAVGDETGGFTHALEQFADGREPHLETSDGAGNVHCIWLITEPGMIARFQHLLSQEPEAYVADGNHRSAAAAMLGYRHFLTVFFPASRMRIAAYNRLVRAPLDDLSALDGAFQRRPTPGAVPFQPTDTHVVGLYTREGWIELVPREGSFDPLDAAASIDHAIVQSRLFGDVLGIEDAGDDRLTFVGANRDAAWLEGEVDSGRADLAVTLPPVTMSQFIAVCRQGKMMPPKSTWFEPKIRSGLVMALL